MDVSVRPWLMTGVALVGASAVAMAPISPSWPAKDLPVAPTAISSSSEVALNAIEIPYILTLPIVRQQIRNWAENWAVYLRGLGQAGIGLAQSVLAIPGVTVEIVQQIFALDFVGAFDTFAQAVRDSVVAVGQPLLDSAIWRNQKYLVVEAALSAAWPQAVIDVANGFLAAGSGVATAFIQGTQDLVAAVLTFDLSNIVDATVDGTRNFLISLGDGARSIVTGIESAQLGIATALATAPPPAPTFDTADLRTPAVDTTLGLSAPFRAVTLDTPALTEKQPDVVDTLTQSEPEDTPKKLAEAEDSAVTDGPVADSAPKRPVRVVKGAVKRVDYSVNRLNDRVTAGVKKAVDDAKAAGIKKAVHDKKDDGKKDDAKPASGGNAE